MRASWKFPSLAITIPYSINVGLYRGDQLAIPRETAKPYSFLDVTFNKKRQHLPALLEHHITVRTQRKQLTTDHHKEYTCRHWQENFISLIRQNFTRQSRPSEPQTHSTKADNNTLSTANTPRLLNAKTDNETTSSSTTHHLARASAPTSVTNLSALLTNNFRNTMKISYVQL